MTQAVTPSSAAALARRFRDEGARAVAVADLSVANAPEGTKSHRCDVTRQSDIAALVTAVLRDHGHIDLFCSNAGVLPPGWDMRDADFDRWRRDIDVNVMAHAYAAKAVLPSMMARRKGYICRRCPPRACSPCPSRSSTP